MNSDAWRMTSPSVGSATRAQQTGSAADNRVSTARPRSGASSSIAGGVRPCAALDDTDSAATPEIPARTRERRTRRHGRGLPPERPRAGDALRRWKHDRPPAVRQAGRVLGTRRQADEVTEQAAGRARTTAHDRRPTAFAYRRYRPEHLDRRGPRPRDAAISLGQPAPSCAERATRRLDAWGRSDSWCRRTTSGCAGR